MTTAPTTWLLLPLLAQIGWTVVLYVWLTVARMAAARRGDAGFATFEFGLGEPPAVARITRNLSNQFELPAIFYAVVVLIVVLNHVLLADVLAAWVFVAGRVAHTAVQTLTSNVRLRGAIFTINFLGLAALVAHLAAYVACDLWLSAS